MANVKPELSLLTMPLDMQRTVRIFAVVIITLFALSVFGWMSVQVSEKDKEFGFLGKPIKQLLSFPELFFESVEEVKHKGLPGTFVKTPEDFVPINKLQSDLMALIAYSDTGSSRSVVLMNLKDDSIHHRWIFDDPIEEYERIFHPLLLPGKNLIYSYKGNDLARVDSMSNLIWRQDQISPHHSKELDKDGNIVLSTYPKVYHGTGYFTLEGKNVYFKDEYITKIDSETGAIIFEKSMTEILRKNNLTNYLLKSGNLSDPIHTNDVQPALKTTPYYNEDDLFISAKNLSVILHFRPSTDEVVNVIEGPFLCQHDIDFYGDDAIVLFNNNFHADNMDNGWKKPKEEHQSPVFAGEFYSSIVKYDFSTRRFSFIADSVFKANKILTRTEGLIEFYEPNAVFVEQQNFGVLWVIKDNEVIYKNVLKSQHQGFHHLPNWTRIIR